MSIKIIDENTIIAEFNNCLYYRMLGHAIDLDGPIIYVGNKYQFDNITYTITEIKNVDFINNKLFVVFGVKK
jgi:hypothetical protein